MAWGDIRYFKVACGEKREISYFATESKEKLQELVNSLKSSFIIEIVERVTRSEARHSKYYDKFAKNYKLCHDGTWDLGKADPSRN